MAGMARSKHVSGLVGLASCLGLAAMLFSTGQVAGQTSPQPVTSDTPEYCLHLLDRVTELVRLAAAPPPHEVASLSTEGQRMCDQGQTRGGILRLRRALMLMISQGGDQ
jgi:hypothetical protein